MWKLEWFVPPRFSCRDQEGGGGAPVERVAGRSCSQREWGWPPLMDAHTKPREVGGSLLGGLQVRRDLGGAIMGMVLFKLGWSLCGEQVLLQSKMVMGPDAGWGVGWLGDAARFPFMWKVKVKVAIHVRRYGGLPSKTTRTDRTIFFIIKIHYEEQT